MSPGASHLQDNNIHSGGYCKTGLLKIVPEMGENQTPRQLSSGYGDPLSRLVLRAGHGGGPVIYKLCEVSH